MQINLSFIIDILLAIIFAIPGIIAFIWKLKDRTKEQLLMEEKFKRALNITFPKPHHYTKGKQKYVSGNLVIENIGDLELFIKTYLIKIIAKGELEIVNAHFDEVKTEFKEKELTYLDSKTGMKFELSPEKTIIAIKYQPKEQSIKKEEMVPLPINFAYRPLGYGDFIIECLIEITEQKDGTKLTEINRNFFIPIPEEFLESKTIIDLDFEYKVIQQDSEKFLLGRIIIENKRNIKTRFQGLKLTLGSVKGKPTIKFYDEKTKLFKSTLDLHKTELIQEWLKITDKKFDDSDVWKVIAITHPYAVENIDFITKIDGSGFFKLRAELVSAPIVGFDDKHFNTEFSAYNIEIFIGHAKFA